MKFGISLCLLDLLALILHFRLVSEDRRVCFVMEVRGALRRQIALDLLIDVQNWPKVKLRLRVRIDDADGFEGPDILIPRTIGPSVKVHHHCSYVDALLARPHRLQLKTAPVFDRRSLFSQEGRNWVPFSFLHRFLIQLTLELPGAFVNSCFWRRSRWSHFDRILHLFEILSFHQARLRNQMRLRSQEYSLVVSQLESIRLGLIGVLLILLEQLLDEFPLLLLCYSSFMTNLA